MNTAVRKSRARRVLTALMWFPPLAVGLMYALAWNHLPPTTHFGIPDDPYRWASRKAHLSSSLATMGSVAILGTFALSLFTKPGFDAYAVLGFFYLMEYAHLCVDYLVIGFNVKGTPSEIALIPIAGIGAAVALISVVLLAHHWTIRPTPKAPHEVRPQ